LKTITAAYASIDATGYTHLGVRVDGDGEGYDHEFPGHAAVTAALKRHGAKSFDGLIGRAFSPAPKHKAKARPKAKAGTKR